MIAHITQCSLPNDEMVIPINVFKNKIENTMFLVVTVAKPIFLHFKFLEGCEIYFRYLCTWAKFLVSNVKVTITEIAAELIFRNLSKDKKAEHGQW